MKPHQPYLLSTAYAPPLQYFTKIFASDGAPIYIEACESFAKQSWRNRLTILGANGPVPLSIPIEKSPTPKTLIRDIRLSEHGHWRHLHQQAIVSAYGSSPYFEYYWEDLRDIWEHPFVFLWDLNETLLRRLCDLLHLPLDLRETTEFVPIENEYQDYRFSIHPKVEQADEQFVYVPYYQLFAGQDQFVPGLTILDLLFNMGPESLLVLQRSLLHP